jgi:hypothetical protein
LFKILFGICSLNSFPDHLAQLVLTDPIPIRLGVMVGAQCDYIAQNIFSAVATRMDPMALYDLVIRTSFPTFGVNELAILRCSGCPLGA